MRVLVIDSQRHTLSLYVNRRAVVRRTRDGDRVLAALGGPPTPESESLAKAAFYVLASWAS